MKTHFSRRAFIMHGAAVPQDLIDSILHAARMAPAAGKRQQ